MAGHVPMASLRRREFKHVLLAMPGDKFTFTLEKKEGRSKRICHFYLVIFKNQTELHMEVGWEYRKLLLNVEWE